MLEITAHVSIYQSGSLEHKNHIKKQTKRLKVKKTEGNQRLMDLGLFESGRYFYFFFVFISVWVKVHYPGVIVVFFFFGGRGGGGGGVGC